MLKTNEFYKHKDNCGIIQIEGFANCFNSSSEPIVIFKYINDVKNNSYCFAGPKYYAKEEELLKDYILTKEPCSSIKINSLKDMLDC